MVFLKVLLLVEIPLGFLWRYILKPLFVNWWRNIVKKHLKRAVRNENIRLKVALPSEDLPYLTLLWVINNGSEKHITVKRVFGCVYTRDKRILVFDAPEPVEKRLGVNLQQNLTIRKTDRHLRLKSIFIHL